MRPRTKKVLLLTLAAVLLVGVCQVQKSMNHDRDALGLTRVQPLENAPPALAFTTVAIGGFRGLISNILWIRASDLQDNDKYFEMAQLADWITKLEPHFAQVWVDQAWNMAYNISVKFTSFSDRWRWVTRGIELLRDEGLRYNPNATLIYRELAWFFQHKLGQDLDDANMYYKQHWADEMSKVFGKQKPNLDELIHPKTPDQWARRRLLIDHYKMDPAFMKQVDQEYGPLEWRLPEASAIYWAALGLKKAQENPTKIKPDDLITLRRVIYQSLLACFQRGRLIANPFAKTFELAPNLDIIPKVNAAYEQAAKEDAKDRTNIEHAHKNFLRDAVYFLYVYHRLEDANHWFNYLCEKYPHDTLIGADTNSLPGHMRLDDYAMARIQEDTGDAMDRKRVQAIIEGLLVNSYTSLIIGEDGRAAGYKLLADHLHEAYTSRTKSRKEAIPIPTMQESQQDIVKRLLDPQHGLPFEERAVLRTKLGLGPETPVAQPTTSPAPTNAPPATAPSAP